MINKYDDMFNIKFTSKITVLIYKFIYINSYFTNTIIKDNILFLKYFLSLDDMLIITEFNLSKFSI